MLLEVAIVDTVPTEHCATYPSAPRTAVKSVIVAPTTSSPRELRVAMDALVHAAGASTMAGVHDGTAEVLPSVPLGEGEDADEVFVLRVRDAGCKLVFTACDRARTWCTEPATAWARKAGLGDPTPTSGCEAGDVPTLRFARDATGLRIRVGDEATAETLLFPF